MLICHLSCIDPYTLLHCSVCPCVRAPNVIILYSSAVWSGFDSLLAVIIYPSVLRRLQLYWHSTGVYIVCLACTSLTSTCTSLRLPSAGTCSVDLPSYVAGSWLGMLPGTIAYVYAGDVGGVKGWQVALGLGITVLAVGYIGKLAKKALDDVEQEEGTSKST